MCVGLAVVAKEPVETLLGGVAGGPGVAQAPFAKGTGYIAFLLKEFPNSDLAIRNRVLAFRLRRLVVTNNRVAGMFAGHQYAT